jgi:hypothetical protein
MAQKRTAKTPSKSRPKAARRRSTTAGGAATGRSAAQPFRLRASVKLEPGAPALQTRNVAVHVKGELVPPARGVTTATASGVAPDDVLEIEFAEGQRVWIRADDYRAQYGGAAARDASGEVLTLPADLQVMPTPMQNRGVVAWVVKSVKILGIDLPAMTAAQIARAVESRASAHRPGLGLYSCRLETDRFALHSAKLPASEESDAKPWLLFIHGTASSTWGSFGDLWSPERARELKALAARYGERVLAFEHETLAVSPIQNAGQLAALLPAGARVHLLTHSRGGLVAELLCRGGAAVPFEPQEIAQLARDKRYTARGPSGKSEVEWLRALDKALRTRAITVERLVRVACPALGTTLASGRLDRWLSVVGSVAGVALPSTPMADAFADIGDFAAAVIKQRTDPRTLPGLEAMMPDSGVVRLANAGSSNAAGDLTVIAGDIEPDAWWARLVVWMTDRFYDGDHDLIVNTASMYGGLSRAGQALLSYHKGPSVNHFTYFRNAGSAGQIVRGLMRAPGDTAGFEHLEQPGQTPEALDTLIARAVIVKPSPKPRPVAIVIPGIMGSELFAGNDRIWISILRLIGGGLKRIAIGAPKITPWQPIVRYYGELQNYLEGSHKVVAFGFDWRLPVEREAQRLAKVVREELKTAEPAGMPVRILAHSMGGLVARTMIANHAEVWQQMCRHAGARLLMLGTPNGGSHAITELIVAQSSALRGLATLDRKHQLRDLLDIVTRFPGVLAMLPKDTREDWFSHDTWVRYHRLADAGWVLPQKSDLEAARRFREAFDRAPIDRDRMLYVAGNADVTVAGMYYDSAARQIRFQGTSRGDGRVTWDSGIPPDVRTWYMDVEHGDLCAYAPAFPALKQLFETGDTMLLPRTPRVPRAAAELFPMPRAPEELFPSEEALTAAVLGAGGRKHRQRPRREPPVQVRVVHGNLHFASHPVVVGHYEGDTILSAEKALDVALAGALSERHQLGRYPGELGTAALFVNPALRADPLATPQGAIVVGLGMPGTLSAQTLTETTTAALLEYVLEWEKHAAVHPAAVIDQGFKRHSVSLLLIGTAAGGVSVSDSVYAMLTAVARSNDALSAARQDARILQVELVEVWEDRAIQAVRAFPGINTDPQLRGRFDFPAVLNEVKGGRRRRTYSEPPGWWHRTQILGGRETGDASTQPLRFTTTTRRARSEVRLLGTQRALVDQFVTEAIGTTRDNRRISRTLFELLLPNELKEAAPDQDNMVLVLDESAARYPWELLEDPSGSRGEPLVIRHGILRQLETREFRESPQGTTELSALVIGDPVSSLVPLPGAQREAETVARTLQAEGKLRVEKRIRPVAQEVIEALYLRPYRVVHLAGHGIYRFPRAGLPGVSAPAPVPGATGSKEQETQPQTVTGMVIGDGMFLTPVEVRQMRSVPDLVFINCCHLGYIEAGGRGDSGLREYNVFAANVATEYIGMGVRAVIAAGWAVDDAAAMTFATAFYNHMLAGVPFGESVKRARRETYDLHTSTNTWGAYQCYGDPDFRLVRDGVESRGAPWEPSFASAAEAAAEIEDLTATLATAAGTLPDWLRGQLGRICAELNRLGWMSKGPIRTALARAYGEALCFEEAVDHYCSAFEGDPGAMTARDVEQMANLMSRSAVELWLRGQQTGGGADGAARIERAIALIQWLLNPPPQTSGAGKAEPGATVERLSLLGSAYKRRAWIGVEVPGSLERMQDAYSRALQLAQASRRNDAYPLLNQLFGQLVLNWHGIDAALLTVEALDAQLEPVSSALRARLATTKEFWDVVMLADIELLEALVAGSLHERRAAIGELYREARKLASPREFASVLDQIGFLAAMCRRAQPELAAELEGLAHGVRPPAVGEPGVSTDDARTVGKSAKPAQTKEQPAPKAARKQKPAPRRKGRPGSASQ